MNTSPGSRRKTKSVRRFGSMSRALASLVLLLGVANASAEDRHLDVLRVGAVTYSNVTVTSKNKTAVFITHDKGMVSFKIADLDDDTLEELGLPLPPGVTPKKPRFEKEPAPELSSTSSVAEEGSESAVSDANAKASATAIKSIKAKLSALAVEIQKRERVILPIALTIGVVVCLLYVLFCRSCAALCEQAGQSAGILIYLPLLKRLPLFKATGISWTWFFVGLFIPFVGFGAWIVCCDRLCGMLQRSKWFVVPMIIPVFGWLVFIRFASAAASASFGISSVSTGTPGESHIVRLRL